MSRHYDIGDVAELRGGFTTRTLTADERATFETYGTLPTGTGATPSSVVCTVRKPDGTSATPSVTGASGVYTAKIPLDQPGAWWYAFDGTGGQQASGEKRLDVRARKVPR